MALLRPVIAIVAPVTLLVAAVLALLVLELRVVIPLTTGPLALLVTALLTPPMAALLTPLVTGPRPVVLLAGRPFGLAACPARPIRLFSPVLAALGRVSLALREVGRVLLCSTTALRVRSAALPGLILRAAQVPAVWPALAVPPAPALLRFPRLRLPVDGLLTPRLIRRSTVPPAGDAAGAAGVRVGALASRSAYGPALPPAGSLSAARAASARSRRAAGSL